MAELKTKPTDQSPDAYIESLENEARKVDSRALLALMRRLTGSEPRMWGTGIIGFGDYRYSYASGREGDWFEIGFAPRKANIALYVMPGVEHFAQELSGLGKYKTGKGCVYITRLSDVDLEALEALISAALKEVRGS